MALTVLRVCSFRGLQNVPIYIARRQGFFAAAGLDVDLTYTTGSVPQLSGLAQGAYDLVQTAPDNVINCDANPAAFGLDSTSAPRIVMVLGGSNGALSLYARPGVDTWEQLRASTLGVDNPSSGFALVLRDLLQRNGMQLGRDYHLKVAGGTDVRCDALMRGAITATILYMPFDLLAEAAGCTRLASSADQYVAYASLATAGVQSWVATHGELVTSYIRSILRALRWLYHPAHREMAQRILLGEPALAPGLDARLAERAYAAFIAPGSGFGRDARLEDAGLRQVLTLRAMYGTAPGPLGEPADYCDARWYDQAWAQIPPDD